MEARLYNILIQEKVSVAKSRQCAGIFTANSIDGVYTHGINRFARFIAYIRKGVVRHDADPVLAGKTIAIEQWDGRAGIGITNAIFCTERAVELAVSHGIGCVALANTNHWMRAGTYGRHAVSKGFAFIGWTNTIANTPAWGAVDPRLGNNPLVLAIPFRDDAIILDMAMSQYSYGALDQYKMKGESLPLPGGFDKEGNLTTDAGSILESRRTLPVGFWKGSGLSLLLDILATVLSGGLSVSDISKQDDETNLSQVFVAFNISGLKNASLIPRVLQQIIDDFHNSVPVDGQSTILYPGERTLATRRENMSTGIPVLKRVWDEVLAL